ncbi:hypothetical protein FQN54_008924 [Arachnomyces sp. PD_36]|nr:hypothetical protein FQN54_008924 [Arachnomyces sp. PD_36]
MPRTAYLAVFTNGKKPAHWALHFPTTNAQHMGKLIHVTGNPASGFFLEFKRSYDFDATERKYQLLSLAEVDENAVKDTPSLSGADTTARDRWETTALDVPPPGRSPNPFDPSARNCQHWMEDYVQELISGGLLPGSAMSVLQSAPRIL